MPALNVRNDEARGLARAIAELTGQSSAAAVIDALRRGTEPAGERVQRRLACGRRVRASPGRGPIFPGTLGRDRDDDGEGRRR